MAAELLGIGIIKYDKKNANI